MSSRFWERLQLSAENEEGMSLTPVNVERVADTRSDLVLACNFLAELREGNFEDRNWARVGELINDHLQIDLGEQVAGLISHGLNNEEIAERINCNAEDLVDVIRTLMGSKS
jgi:hypothetical protein